MKLVLVILTITKLNQIQTNNQTNSNYKLFFIDLQPTCHLPVNMIDYLGYNLTEYKAFRQLELQYIKTMTVNQTLQSQVDTLKQAYDHKCAQLLQIKKEDMKQKIKTQNSNLKYKKLYKQLLQLVQASLLSFKGSKQSPKGNGQQSPKGNGQQSPKGNSKLAPLNNINQSHISQQQSSLNHSSISRSHPDKSLFIHQQQTQTLQKISKTLLEMTKSYQYLQAKNTTLTKRIQTFENLYKSESLQKEKTEIMIVKQVQHLQGQLQELNQVNIELQAKINIKDKQRRKLDLELRHYKQDNSQLSHQIQQLIKDKQSHPKQQDTQFVIDFMTFQLHTIQSIFTKITQQTKCSTDISNLMSILYSDYEQLSQIFRQKLQIEYDLEDLEQRYKSQKSSSQIDDHLLIQTRRQIQAFRLQLLKQKQLFRQKEHFIEDHFNQYTKVNEQQMKIKNYSYELQNRLYNQKRSGVQTSERFVTTRNPTARQILLKRTVDVNDHNKPELNTNAKNVFTNSKDFLNSGNKDFLNHDGQEETVDKQDSSSMPSKKTSLRFKQTNNAQEIMNEIIKKDKANMEKILKDTRKTQFQIYVGK